MNKIKNIKSIAKITAVLRKRGKKIVFTNGCFDILHYGHLKYLKKCKNLGDVLIVGLNSDSSVKKLKGAGRPLTKQAERAAVLSALEFVDYVVIFGESTPARLIESVAPDILAKGGDWRPESIVGGKYVKTRGGR
ncbi:MAG: adenylyltransferase/cytidyltransferase family protein, partial [Candidatus Omnitrophica bacterium]|nr:adenylyltransferase/cytidyltransferase family protein [Candidatus Omnitrophota bacterium]